MYFSRKTILTKGKKPLYAASRVLNASSASASNAFSRCWFHSTTKTSALLSTVKSRGLRRVYYTTKHGADGASSSAGSGGPEVAVPLYSKLVKAWTDTPTKWYPLPIAVGALLLVAIQYRRKSRRMATDVELDENGQEVIKLTGPWQVHVLGALPLRNMSRLWGYVSSIELPIWARPYSFKLYALAFGCNLDEIEPSDLRAYASLGDFFYRKLKDGTRPVANATLVSPADGTVLHFGRVDANGDPSLGPVRVEQVKGITYSLDALLGVERPDSPKGIVVHFHNPDEELVHHQEFANVNGIEYSLEQLLGSSSSSGTSTPSDEQTPLLNERPKKYGSQMDASVISPHQDPLRTLQHDTQIAQEIQTPPSTPPPSSSSPSSSSPSIKSLRPGHSLFFSVIYLAPGDYHRFHSPTAWVVEKRRHFIGELFSVSPYVVKRLKNVFVLNERVALLGRWKYGFFGMVPVGATNVGSIKINFDKELRTNEVYRRHSDSSSSNGKTKRRLPPVGTYSEAVYNLASPLLHGQPLEPAQEMGGFCLGSTIVLVFEAPDEFEFVVGAGEKVKVGQRLGDVKERLEELGVRELGGLRGGDTSLVFFG
ncbi:hypothetical protein AGABI1DRAFT_108406 [Agaricus bisporus var. burnettii JB137-S8]|uniref:Phosphatidylserine decarboxylase proenzyme 1, mitochondrial n=1 Tax=Agaricus bisporus var. burnettii (strain JB137-S8 / ATCC MYA-4627 / FGSC 10392) TaxID=597362 RepID=K5X1K0_AGABU|nr:uncharacterized protein AGABI1DRAFT_108406 [Agaricus bisporus var. burnettii JB137-S8]EKM77018.1 hypothetical protein AGABI1DRAFT_108406 [Agaricus bisporus var. burnettii JB137-S8]